jgi:hypothetical protein
MKVGQHDDDDIFIYGDCRKEVDEMEIPGVNNNQLKATWIGKQDRLTYDTNRIIIDGKRKYGRQMLLLSTANDVRQGW